MEGTMRNLSNALIVATMAAGFATLFWTPVGGAVVHKKETYSVTSGVHLPFQNLEPVW
jgi:hypothetical protein